MPRRPHRQPATLALLTGTPLLFGLLALWLGLDANWDLRNYHYYNAYAFLNDRWGWDILPSQSPSFYNPTLDLPYYWLVENLPAQTVGFILGAVQGLNFIPLFLLAYSLLAIDDLRRRWLAAAGLALAGMLGADTVSEYGTVFHDNLVSIGINGAAAIVVCQWSRLGAPGRGWIGPAALAGLSMGLAFGLKQNTVIFAIGGCFAFLLVPGPFWRRFWLSFVYGLGVLAGLGIGGGHWMWYLWQHYGNPLFPYYNHIFQSPWGLLRDYRDPGFLPQGFDLWEVLSFPFRFSFDYRITTEVPFRDFRVLAAYVLLPLAGLAALLRRLRRSPAPEPLTQPGASAYLMVFAALSYGLWLYMFRIYRYLIPLEMLAPILIVAALGRLPLPRARAAKTALVLVTLIVLTTQPADWGRVPWSAKAIEVGVPQIAAPEHTLVLMAGHEPYSYLLPAFPPQLRFVRIDSNFTNIHERNVAFNPLMQRIVAEHRGPLAVLYAAHEVRDVRRKLQEYGLALTATACQNVPANLAGDVVYLYCPVFRQGEPVYPIAHEEQPQ
ncbi:MAG TPA: hypothetical protein VNN09_05160 [Candidatus Competibacteraceae bacterium]|nr:hypothetical protein [Candidatus Competibacteraceae bacterium]